MLLCLGKAKRFCQTTTMGDETLQAIPGHEVYVLDCSVHVVAGVFVNAKLFSVAKDQCTSTPQPRIVFHFEHVCSCVVLLNGLKLY
jgi:hypothetical protein